MSGTEVKLNQIVDAMNRATGKNYKCYSGDDALKYLDRLRTCVFCDQEFEAAEPMGVHDRHLCPDCFGLLMRQLRQRMEAEDA